MRNRRPGEEVANPDERPMHRARACGRQRTASSAKRPSRHGARIFPAKQRRPWRALKGMSSSKALAFEHALEGEALPNESTRRLRSPSRWDVDFLQTPRSCCGAGVSAFRRRPRPCASRCGCCVTGSLIILLAAEYRRVADRSTSSSSGRTTARCSPSRGSPRGRVGAEAPRYRRWLGVDAVPKRNILRLAGYRDILQADIEAPNLTLPDGFDSAICLHIFEHTRTR